MAPSHKSPKRYFVVSSMDMHPSSVKLGSIITNLNRPDKPLSTFTPVIPGDCDETSSTYSSSLTKGASDEVVSDTALTVTTAHNSTGDLKRSGSWGLGVFATFLQQLIQGAKLSVAKSSASQFSFAAKEITTLRFVPSAQYVRAALADEEVASFLRRNGRRARVYMIVSVKVARQLTVMRADSEKCGVEGVLGVHAAVAGADGTVGVKGQLRGSSGFYHKEDYPGPVVFAFEVEQIRLRSKGEVERVDSDRLNGTMLGRAGGEDEEKEEFEIVTDDGVDEDMLEQFGVEGVAGVDERGEACEVFVGKED
jgi:hypothetical protein